MESQLQGGEETLLKRSIPNYGERDVKVPACLINNTKITFTAYALFLLMHTDKYVHLWYIPVHV